MEALGESPLRRSQVPTAWIVPVRRRFANSFALTWPSMMVVILRASSVIFLGGRASHGGQLPMPLPRNPLTMANLAPTTVPRPDLTRTGAMV